MASLSNINGLFDVHSTGAILFSTSHGTSGQILKSNGNAAPTWVDASTIIGGPYLPLTGGTLTGNLAISGSNSLTVGGALSAGVTTITSDTGLIVYSSTNAVGANITFSDVTDRSQKGFIKYFHQDTASYGSANAFVVTSDQDTMTVLADGKLMYKEGVYLKPATGTGGGARKDNLWDAAYNDKITALAVTGTTTKTLTATQQDGGTLTATWTDNDGGGTVTGTGANTQVAFWTGTSVIDGSSDLIWDNTNKELGIGRNPDYPLDVYKSSGTSSSTTGTTMQRLWNYVGGDLNQQKTFIDFVFQDGNDNEYPQVRIGAEVGQNGDADTQIKEGSGAFVVYTNNATSAGPGSPTGLAERFRVDYAGNVGIGTTSPDTLLHIYNPDTNWGAYSVITLGTDVEGTNQAQLKYYRGASTSTESFQLSVRGTTALTALYNGNVGIGTTTPEQKLHVEGTIQLGNTEHLSWAYDDGSYYNYITNGYNSTDGVTYRGGSWTSNQAVICHSFETYTGGWQKRLVIRQDGNVGIGNTSPGALLDVGATIHPNTTGIDVTGVNCIGLNTVDNHNWFPYTDGNNYYSATKHQFRGGTNNGPNYMMLDSTGLGIGNTSPVYKLDITGSGMRIKDVGDVEIIVNADTDNADETHSPVMRFLQDGTQNMLNVGSNGSSGTPDFTGLLDNAAYVMGGTGHSGTVPLQFGTGGISFMIIKKSGSLPLVGINTTNPAATLEVNTNGGFEGSLRLDGTGNTSRGILIRNVGTAEGGIKTDGNFTINIEDANRTMRFKTANTERMSIGSGGIINVPNGARIDVGPGTWKNGSYPNNPAARLNVECDGDNAINIYNTQENYAYLRFIDSQSNGAQYARIGWSSGTGNPMVINNMGNDAITINDSGYVGIGNTSPQTPLHVGTTTTVTNQFTNQVAASNFFVNGNANGGASFFQCKTAAVNINMMGNNDFACNQFTFYHKPLSTSQNVVGTIATFSSSTQYNTTSDYRLKENIIPLSDSITRLKQLKPSRFNFIEDPERTMDGFLAHEVQDIVPEAVNGEKDAVDENGNEVHQGIDQAKLVPLLVAAVQELEARVKELENR